MLARINNSYTHTHIHTGLCGGEAAGARVLHPRGEAAGARVLHPRGEGAGAHGRVLTNVAQLSI